MGGVYVPPMQDKSLMTTIMKGLAIARDVYGLKSDMDQSERTEREDARIRAERERLAAGKLNRGEVQGMQLKGYREAPAGTSGGVEVLTTYGGPKVLVPPGKQGPLQQVVTKDASGKPVTKFVRATEGAEYAKPEDTPGAYKVSQDLLGHTTDLRNKYDSDPTTKRTLGVIDAYKAIKGAAEAEAPTGATDIRLVYSFMKAMDPNSTVREGEYATAENSGGAWTKIGNVYNRILSGERLSPEQRASFAQEAEAMVGDQLASQAETDRRYAELAKRYNVNARDIVDSRFSGFKPSGKRQSPSVSASPKAAGKPGPGSVVEVGGKRYRVAADGDTLEPVTGTAGP